MRRIHQECRHGSFEAARFASVAVLTVDCRKNVQVSVAKLLAVVFAQAAFFALNTNGFHGSVFTCRLISSSCARAIEAFGKCSLLRPQTDFFLKMKFASNWWNSSLRLPSSHLSRIVSWNSLLAGILNYEATNY
jgi:hypothetical protein